MYYVQQSQIFNLTIVVEWIKKSIIIISIGQPIQFQIS
jgi:hypothetical protein